MDSWLQIAHLCGRVQEIGCCSGAKVHTTERYKGLAGRGPRPSDLSEQKWGAPRKGSNGNGELEVQSCITSVTSCTHLAVSADVLKVCIMGLVQILSVTNTFSDYISFLSCNMDVC